MSFPISNIVSQCQLLGHVLTSVNQISKGASPAGVWNCCAMIPAFVVQWSLLLVWPQTFISTMCLKCNFSPTLASMHGNEALKSNPMPQKSERTTLECLHGDSFKWFLGVHPPELKVSNMFPISSLKDLDSAPLQYLGCNISPRPLQYLGWNTSPISGLKYLSNIMWFLVSVVEHMHTNSTPAFPALFLNQQMLCLEELSQQASSKPT